MRFAHYSELAELLDFPGPDYVARGNVLLANLRKSYPAAARELELFLDAIPAKVVDLQELYTRTFEVQSLTTLGVGYIMFGDDYKRGEVLTNLNREHALVHNDCRGELSDHLPNVLRLVPLLEDSLLREELIREMLVPALTLMLREFDPERIVKKNQSYRKHYKTLIDTAAGTDSTIYRRALGAVLNVMMTDFEIDPEMAIPSGLAAKPGTAGFLGMLEKELEIERTSNPMNSGRDN